jgi:mannitol/fructose-specific phosphotransferase system IIA component (Ntr-type)
MNLIRKALLEGSVLLDLDVSDLGTIFERTLDHIVFLGLLAADDRHRVEDALLEREEQVSTAIGHAVAIPHAYFECFAEPVIVFVRLKHPLNLGAPDGIPTRFLFILLGPEGVVAEHLDTLTSIARLMSNDDFRFDAAVARDQQDLLAALAHFEARTSADAVEEAVIPEGLRYTSTFFGGLVQDFRRRLPHYVSDFKDGLHPKSLSSTLFLFFACLAPAVTFGGIMAELTGDRIGAVEMIVGTALCGVIYALFSGQPLIILGGTGPLLIFTMILYQLCGPENLDIPFLETRAWIGL